MASRDSGVATLRPAQEAPGEEQARPALRKRFWSNDMEAVFGVMVVLVILGTVNVFSSSFVLAETRYDDTYFFLRRHLVSLTVGIVAFIVGARVDYHKWRAWMPIVIGATLFFLVAVFFFGAEVNGAHRWIRVGPVQFQPAEGAKVVALMLAAAYLSALARRGRPWHGIDLGVRLVLNPQSILILLMAILVEQEPDMGTACFIVGVPLVMYVVGARFTLKSVGFLSALVAVAFAFMVTLQPYRMDRVRIMFDPWQDAQDTGYQIVQSLSTIGSGELFGMGLGVGVSKYDYLPEAHTDFAFAIFCQENGYLGALFVLLLFTALAVYGIRIASKAGDYYGQLLALGIVVLVVGQAACNMLMVGGMFPVVGVPLPFISYGGSSLIFTMFAMGILVSIGRLSEREKKRRAKLAREREAREQAKVQRKRASFRLVKGKD